jgi:hypothetical protein
LVRPPGFACSKAICLEKAEYFSGQTGFTEQALVLGADCDRPITGSISFGDLDVMNEVRLIEFGIIAEPQIFGHFF